MPLYLCTVNLAKCHAPVSLLASPFKAQDKLQTHMTFVTEALYLASYLTCNPVYDGTILLYTSRCKFRSWRPGRQPAFKYDQKATQNPTTLGVRPNTYPTIPTYPSARDRDTTRTGLVINFTLWCSGLDTATDTEGSVIMAHLTCIM